MAIEIGSKVTFHSYKGPAKGVIVGEREAQYPFHKRTYWLVNITSRNHPVYVPGEIVEVTVGTTFLSERK